MSVALFPFSFWECWWLGPLVLALDLWLGDPALPWRHPVCLVGAALEKMEGPARRYAGSGASEALRGRLAGAVALAVLVLGCGLAVRLLVALPVLGTILAVYLSWAGLAMGSLLRAGQETLEQVECAPLSGAREALSRLVSRETAGMDRPLMRKTLADTLSENLTDAFVAPFFWLLVGGPVGLWCYKAVSTADSMWGYTTPRWRWLGWAGARADDMLAWIPARLAALSLWLAHTLAVRRRPWRGVWPGLHTLARQARGMPSPNSGWPMTAAAWLCGARMAGPSVYFGVLASKPWLGPEEGAAAAWDRTRLLALCALLRYAALCGGLCLWLAGCAFLLLSG